MTPKEALGTVGNRTCPISLVSAPAVWCHGETEAKLCIVMYSNITEKHLILKFIVSILKLCCLSGIIHEPAELS